MRKGDRLVTIEDLTIIHAPVERCFDLARSVEVHLWRNVHCAAPAAAIAGVTTGLVGMGQRVTWRAKHFGVWHNLTAEITAMDRPVYFQNTMIQGIFRLMKHDHFFRPVSREETEMRNVYCFAAPLPVLGRVAEISFLRRYMQALLRERTAAVKEIAESSKWQEYLP
jgi:ligand-binding SRPBCC domain-containing protein